MGSGQRRLSWQDGAGNWAKKDEKSARDHRAQPSRVSSRKTETMNYQPYLRPGFPVDAIPEPRVKLRRLMQATALAVEGLVDTRLGQVDPRLQHCLYMPQANLIIAGTGCRRPLLLREAADVSAAASCDVLVVRSEDSASQATFDLKRAGVEGVSCAYRMWMPRPSEAAWLIPTAGEKQFFRITPLALETNDRAPYVGEADRQIGLIRAAEFLSVAVQGWF